jgi:Bifunctional DNA primase/polymerase, N-terminal
MKLILPEHLRELHSRPMAEAFKVYRDELGMHVYPCTSPKARVKDPGKQPAISSWWEFDPCTCDVSRFFGDENGRCCNIGTCAISDLKYLDLDSKHDQGASVRQHVETHPVLSKLPQHLTRGGVHLVFICPDMPKWVRVNGRPYRDRLVAEVTSQIRAELFHCDHNNIILPPSVHSLDNFIYTWTILGEVPVLAWKEILALYAWIIPGQTQRPPGRPKKEPPWFHRYHGFIGSLDLVGLLTELKVPVDLIDAEDCKYRIKCPWEKEHSETRSNGRDTSTVIWQPGTPHWPSFKCLHSHGPSHSLEHVLAWAEEQTPGIVDRFCAQARVWSRGQKSAGGLPRILKPNNELDSAVYIRIADIVAPHHIWFIRGDQPTVITDVPSGFGYTRPPGPSVVLCVLITVSSKCEGPRGLRLSRSCARRSWTVQICT